MIKTAWSWTKSEAIRQDRYYSPGGLAIYSSTVLMAYSRKDCRCQGDHSRYADQRASNLNPLIAAAAEIGGVTRIFKVGGAPAIAALAYGTQSIPQVDKIVGREMLMWRQPRSWFLEKLTST